MPQLTWQFLVFCASSVALWWLFPRRIQPLLLVLASAGFLVALDPLSAALLIGTTLLTELAARRAQ